MPQSNSQHSGLKKELGLFDVYAIATGATLSSGFFLLPGLAAIGAGPALPLSYMIAALVLLPGLISKAELATAMPRAGGVYYFLDRSMGPLMGTMGGFGTWFALILKTAFALVGVGAYLGIFFPDVPIAPLAAAFAMFFGVINLFGAKKSGSAQVILVIGLLLLLAWFTGMGVFQIDGRNFIGFFEKGSASIFSTAGLVVVSYMGLTKVASVAEEVKNPERNLPLGMFLSLATAMVVYAVGTSVMIGVLSADKLAGDLTPVATVAEVLVGRWGAVLMTIGAVLAFSSVGNAGILSASRYPLAMSRDQLLPPMFGKLGKHGTPANAIYITVALILVFVILLDPTKIAKLASTFKLLMFALSCLAVIVMRESHLASYDPGYHSPFYPWLQLAGIAAPVYFIGQMGWLSIAFSGGLLIFGALWYRYYARDKVVRNGAIYHMFERLGRSRYEGLDRELRGILKEKGLNDEAPYEHMVAHSTAIDLKEELSFEEIVNRASQVFADRLSVPAEKLAQEFMDGSRYGATPVSHGAALPHQRLTGIQESFLVMVRCQTGLTIILDEQDDALNNPNEPVYAIFFLVSPEDFPSRHLRTLANIASCIDENEFMGNWRGAKTERELKVALLRRKALPEI